jgi:hypothetical protein
MGAASFDATLQRVSLFLYCSFAQKLRLDGHRSKSHLWFAIECAFVTNLMMHTNLMGVTVTAASCEYSTLQVAEYPLTKSFDEHKRDAQVHLSFVESVFGRYSTFTWLMRLRLLIGPCCKVEKHFVRRPIAPVVDVEEVYATSISVRVDFSPVRVETRDRV